MFPRTLRCLSVFNVVLKKSFEWLVASSWTLEDQSKLELLDDRNYVA